MMTDTSPTLAGFEHFMQTVMEVPASAMPSDDTIAFVYGVAEDLTLPDIRLVSGRLYTAALYHLAASTLIQCAQDHPTSPTPHYWQNLRASLGMNGFTPGIIASSSDNGTSQSWSVPDTLKNLSLSDLQMLKNPYGQFYLSLAQQFGTVWAMA